MKRTKLVWIIDLMCAALLIGITVWVMCRYGTLLDKIPVHYNANGTIDGYGPKSMIWVFVAMAWIVVVTMTAIEQFPRHLNIPFKVAKGNRYRLLTLAWHWISTTKLAVLGICAYLTIMAMQGGNLSVFVLPAILILLGANSIYWIIRIFLNR